MEVLALLGFMGGVVAFLFYGMAMLVGVVIRLVDRWRT